MDNTSLFMTAIQTVACNVGRLKYRVITRLLSRVLFAIAVFLAGSSLVLGQAQYVGPVPNVDYKAGYVLARSVILDPDTGEPILVEFGEDGNEVKLAETAGNKTSDLIVYPAADYRFHKMQLSVFQEQYKESIAKDAELMSRRQFEQASFLYADNKTPIAQEALGDAVSSVLVRAQNSRFVPLDGVDQKPNEILLLLKFDVDLTQSIEVEESDKSLLVNQDGQVVAQSNNTIGYRVGFYGDPNDPSQARTGRIGLDDTVYGPIPNANVYVDKLRYPGGQDVSKTDGRYSFSFHMGVCPVGGFDYNTDVWAELKYQNFLPSGAPSIPYYLRTPGYSYCYADLVPIAQVPEVTAILATIATPSIQTNLYVDVMFLAGRIQLRNANGEQVPVGETTYTTFEEPAKSVTQRFYDFNGDGESDHVERGRVLSCENIVDAQDQKDIFLSDTINDGPLSGAKDEVLADYTCEEPDPASDPQPGELGNWQAVFFDGSQEDVEDFPDLVRVIDKEFRNEEIGVLKSISQDDMRNTDVYLFRESTGQLILERRGLKQEEAEYRPAVEYDENLNAVAYRIMLRGNRDWNLNLGGGVDRTQSFEDWTTDYQLTEPFQQREADHPRPGEFIKVVVVNRATGYTGTARVQLSLPSNDNGLTGLLDVQAPEISLTPPNLKIWAERDYEVEQGLTKGEERNYTIGNEGASLTSDTSIRVYTEWLDEQGKPLPDELGLDNGAQYGLTGRLAKVVGDNQLRGIALADDMAEFPIAPGRNTQILRLKNGAANNGTEHFYVHVIGKAKEQECVAGSTCPQFDLPSDQPELEGRPKLLTPFLTPLWDEDKSWLEYRSYRAALGGLEEALPDGGELSEAEQPVRPLPAYAWQYRPEYQFSQFDLEVREVNRANQDADGNETVTNIIDADTQAIASSDDYVEALYSLISSDFDVLGPIDGGQELILALGEQEQRITFGEDQTIRFSDVASLANLDVEDLLSLRLYGNNDAGNVLWEYAFASRPFPSIEELEISVDDISMEFQLFLSKLEPEKRVSLAWSTSGGSGTRLETQSTSSEDSIIENTLFLGEKSERELFIEVQVVGGNSDYYSRGSKWTYGPYTTTPGEPQKILLSTIEDGSIPADSVSEIEINAEILDQFGNRVEEGTPVEWLIEDTGELIEVSNEASENGESRAIYKVSEQVSAATITLSSGFASAEIELEKHPLTLNVSSSKQSLIADGSDFVDITVDVEGSDQLDGIEIGWTTTDGSLLAPSSRLQDGTATIRLFSGFNQGEIIVGAHLPGFSEFLKLDTVRSTSTVASLSLPAIVNEAQDGVVEVDTLEGTTLETFETSTELTVYGQPGQVFQIAAGSTNLPNGAISNLFLMSELFEEALISDTPYIRDSEGTLLAKATGHVELVEVDPFSGESESYGGIGNSIFFDRAFFEAESVTTLHRDKDFYVNLKFRIDDGEDNVTLLRKGSDSDLTYQLGLRKDGAGNYKLFGELRIADQVHSIELGDVVSKENWYIASLRYSNGLLSIGLDQSISTQVVTGEVELAPQDKLTLGSPSFVGYLDEVKFGDLAANRKIVSMLNNTVEIGPDGTGSVVVQATGNRSTQNQVVGFTVTSNSMAQLRRPYELVIASSVYTNDNFSNQVSSRFSLWGLLGIESAIAQSTSCNTRRCIRDRQRANQRNGVSTTSKGLWGSVKDAIQKKLLGDEVVDAVKTTAKFIFELTSINDIWVIMKAIYHLGTRQTDKIEGFELTFAILGVGLTIFAVITSGGSILIPLKLALSSFKGFLRALWKEIGGDLVLRGVSATGRYMWQNIKLFVDGQRTLARQQMADFASALGKVVNNAGELLGPFFRLVRSPSDLVHFMRLARRDTCFVPVIGNQPSSSGALDLNGLALFDLFISPVHAQVVGCLSRLKFISGLSKQAERFGDAATAQKVSDGVFNVSRLTRLDNLSPDELDGLAEVVFQHLKRRPNDDLLARFKQGAEFFSVDDLRKGLRAIDELSVANTIRKIPGYEGFVSKFATRQKFQNDPIGTIHAARTVESIGVENVLKFERRMKNPDEFPDIDTIADAKAKNPLGRRIDVQVKENTNVELKGSSKDSGSYSLTGLAEIEFLNDAIYFSRVGQKFEWRVAPQLDLAAAKNKMLKLLGSGSIPDRIDPRLLKLIDELDEVDGDAADSMIERLTELFRLVESGQILKHSEYID